MDFIRVFAFDFSKALDSVSHHIVCSKLKLLDFIAICHQFDYPLSE